MSRTESRYSEILDRSFGPSPLSRSLVVSLNESKMLLFRRRVARCSFASVLPTSPNKRSNTRRGLFSIGIGDVGVRQHNVFTYAQLQPFSQAPKIPAESRLTSSEESCVYRPNSFPTI